MTHYLKGKNNSKDGKDSKFWLLSETMEAKDNVKTLLKVLGGKKIKTSDDAHSNQK